MAVMKPMKVTPNQSGRARSVARRAPEMAKNPAPTSFEDVLDVHGGMLGQADDGVVDGQ
jgi:hypothetical protein